MEIWVNPACSKCAIGDRAAGRRRRRLHGPALSRRPADRGRARRRARAGSALEPWDVARLGEPVAAELGLRDLPRERRRWLELLAAHPILIQRPIITADDGTTVIGRSEEAVRSVIDDGADDEGSRGQAGDTTLQCVDARSGLSRGHDWCPGIGSGCAGAAAVTPPTAVPVVSTGRAGSARLPGHGHVPATGKICLTGDIRHRWLLTAGTGVRASGAAELWS